MKNFILISILLLIYMFFTIDLASIKTITKISENSFNVLSGLVVRFIVCLNTVYNNLFYIINIEDISLFALEGLTLNLSSIGSEAGTN
jgi:hypothetical protein